MTRLPFDPARVEGPPVAGETPVRTVAPLTVSQASELIKNTLEQRLPAPLRIVGEVSNLRRNQHWYFSLKDSEAVLNCVAWATSARRFKFSPKDGDQIVATGHISHFAPQGRTQMYVSAIEPVGAGALDMKFRALCDELRGLGYFDEARKKPLPVFPRRIAVITSATSAAVQDVIHTAQQRCKAVGLLIVDVRVQGEGAAEEVARAIRWVDAQRARLGVDAILVTRGGGSMEDLWAFNERIVADAVHRCTLPVVAAIGHESDTTIIELVADRRASTPTQAAMWLVPSSTELCAQIDHLAHRMKSLLQRNAERQVERAGRAERELRRAVAAHLAQQHRRLSKLQARLSELHPTRRVAQQQARLAVLRHRLDSAVRGRLDQRVRIERLRVNLRRAMHFQLRRRRERVVSMERHLAAIDPLAVLRRGYSITTLADGRVVRSVVDAARGDVLVTRLSDGRIESEVKSTAAADTSTPSPASATAKESPRPPRGHRPPNQLDLFNFGR